MGCELFPCVEVELFFSGKGNSVSIQFEEDGTYQEVGNDGSKKQLAPAKITLNDCLACRCGRTVDDGFLCRNRSVGQPS